MSKQKDYYKICEEFVEKHHTGNNLSILLDAMLARVAIEVVEKNYNIKVPITLLFDHLKYQLKVDRDFKKRNLEKLEKVELVKILKGVS